MFFTASAEARKEEKWAYFVEPSRLAEFRSARTERRVVLSPFFFDAAPGRTRSSVASTFRKELLHAHERLTHGAAQHGAQLSCLCCRARTEDGVSWLAEEAHLIMAQELKKAQGGSKVFALCGWSNAKRLDLDGIVDPKVIRKVVNDVLGHSGGGPARRFLKHWSLAMIGVLGGLASFMATADPGTRINFLSMAFLLPTGAGLVLGIAQHYLATWLDRGKEEKQESTPAERLLALAPNDPDYTDAIGRLAKRLRTGLYRVVVVDDLSRMDRVTTDVVRRYMVDFDRIKGDGNDLWVFADRRKKPGSFYSEVVAHTTPVALRSRCTLLEVQSLNKPEKEDLRSERSKLELETDTTKEVVKLICVQGPAHQNEVTEGILASRGTLPRAGDYGHFDLFQLMALEAGSPIAPRSANEWVQVLQPTGLAREVLHLFLGIKDSSKRDMEAKLEPLLGTKEQHERALDMHRFIQIFDTNNTLRYAMESDVREVMERADRKLFPRDHGLGHLFWCFEWERRCRKEHRATFYAKFIHHLLKQHSVHEWVDVPWRNNARKALFQMHQLAINGAMLTGLYDQLDKLFDGSIELLKGGGMDATAPHALALSLLRAYTINEEDHYLKLLEDLADQQGLVPNAAPAAVPDHLAIYWDSAAFHEQNTTTPNLLHGMLHGTAAPGMDIMQDRALARAAWLRTFTYPLATGYRCFDARFQDERPYVCEKPHEMNDLRTAVDRCLKRLAQPDAVVASELLTISEAIWTISVRASGALRSYAEGKPGPPEPELINKQWMDRLRAVVNGLEELHKARNNPQHKQVDNRFVEQAAILEACASIHMALLLPLAAWPLLGTGPHADPRDLEALVKRLVAIYQLEAPGTLSAETLPGYLAQAQQAGRLCAYTWMGLDLEQRARSIMLRTAQFDRYTRSVRPDLDDDGLGTLVGEADLYACLANLLRATDTAVKMDVRSNDMKQILVIAKEGIAPMLVEEVLMAIILDYHGLPRRSLELDEDRMDFFRKGRFRSLLDQLTDEWLGRMLEASSTFSNVCATEEVDAVVRQDLLHAVNERGQERVPYAYSLWNCQETVRRIEAGEPFDAPVELAYWRNAPYQDHYLRVLQAALLRPEQHSEINDEALGVLANIGQGDLQVYHLNMARRLGRALLSTNSVTPERADLLADVIQRGMDLWDGTDDPANDISFYSALRAISPRHQAYCDTRIEQCELRLADNEGLNRLGTSQDRHWHEVYTKCYRIMKLHGLNLMEPMGEIDAQLNEHGHAAGARFEAWSRKQEWPDPVGRKDGKAALVGGFLVLGHLFFDTHIRTIDAYDHWRAEYRSRAQAHYPLLKRLVAEASGLPASSKDILTRYFGRLESVLETEEAVHGS